MLSENSPIQPAYRTIYNAIVQPNRVFTISQYFLRYWLPQLKPSLAWLIIALQQRCYWNEQKNWCTVSQEKLAQDTGLSERTIRSLLKEPQITWFMTHRKQYRYNAQLGRTVRDRTVYAIYQDDPLTPEHQAGLARLLADAGVDNLADTLLLLASFNGRALAERLEAAAAGETLNSISEGTVTAVAEFALANPINAEMQGLCEAVQHRLTQGQGLPLLGTQYFRLNWVPILGVSLSWLVLILRNSCYQNPESGEVRDVCEWPKTALREALGESSRRQINNLLQHPASSRFFQDAGSTKNQYCFKVQMWQDQEPLTPTDQIRLKNEGNVLLAVPGQLEFGLTEAFDHEELASTTVKKLPVEAANREKFAAITVKNLPVVTSDREKIASTTVKKLPVEAANREKIAGHVTPLPGKNCRTHEDSLNTLNNNNHYQQQHVGDDNVSHSGLSLLDLLDIRPPTRESLAELPHMLPEYLEQWVKWDTSANRDAAGARLYGPGWIVLQLRSGLYPPADTGLSPDGLPPVASAIAQLYAAEIGPLTTLIRFLILEATDPEGENLGDFTHWETAFKSAVSANVRQWNYVLAVARREHAADRSRQQYQAEQIQLDSFSAAQGDAPESELDRLWRTTQDMVKGQTAQATFDAWISGTRLAEREGSRFTVVVKNSYAKEWLENRLYTTVQRALINAIKDETDQAEVLVELDFVLAEG
jgi:hypothetical protein